MAIYVDLCLWPSRGRLWCHLMTDGESEELLAFGRLLGLRDEWRQDVGTPREHYDLPPDTREAALAAGAIPVSPQELVRRCVIPKRERGT